MLVVMITTKQACQKLLEALKRYDVADEREKELFLCEIVAIDNEHNSQALHNCIGELFTLIVSGPERSAYMSLESAQAAITLVCAQA